MLYKTDCPDCNSADNLAVYEDHGFCFTPGCGYKRKKDDINMDETRHVLTASDPISRAAQRLTLDVIAEYRSYSMGSRKIDRDVVDYFNVRMSTSEDGLKAEAHYYPYTRNGKIVAYKQRQPPCLLYTSPSPRDS